MSFTCEILRVLGLFSVKLSGGGVFFAHTGLDDSCGSGGRMVPIDETLAFLKCRSRAPESETVGVKQPRSSPEYAPYKLYKPGYKPAYKLL